MSTGVLVLGRTHQWRVAPGATWRLLKTSVVLTVALAMAAGAWTLGGINAPDATSPSSLVLAVPSQDLTASFAPEGVQVRSTQGASWSWSLSPSAYGYEGALQTLESTAPTSVAADRVEYRRGPLTEWYLGDHRGLEQGFTLERRPPGGSGTLQLHQELSGDLLAVPRDGGLSLVDTAGTPVLTYDGLRAWDATGRDVPATMTTAANTLVLSVEDRGATYPLTIDPLVATQEAHLFASDGATGDQFGIDVAIDGDTAVVGAIFDDTADGADAGSAYVYVKSGGSWSQQAHLFASDGSPSHQFGSAVDIEGDRAVIGAAGDDDTIVNGGAGYVFERAGGVWSEDAKLVPAEVTLGAFAGGSVSVSGDRAVLGAGGNNTGGENAGSAYIFREVLGSWAEELELLASDAAEGDEFGHSVAIDGTRIVVGASDDDTAAGDTAGSVYFFEAFGGLWAEVDHEFGSSAFAAGHLGISVDLDGDSAVAGAYNEAPPGPDAGGAVYVFVKSGGTWSEQARLLGSDVSIGDSFGWSVDLDGDTLVAGAILDDTPAGTSAGSAYLFTRSGSSWTEEDHFFASDPAASDQFGYAMALSGSTAVASAFQDDTAGGLNAGSAYVFGIGPRLCQGVAVTMAGTDGNDVIEGTTGPDVIDARAGHDTVIGLGGGDRICLGPGTDIGEGRGGKDVIFGQDGNDTIRAQGGDDNLLGGAGNDKLIAGPGNDNLDGGGGVDTCSGQAGTDTADATCEKVTGVP